METLYLLLFLSIAFELFEISWQKDENMMKMLLNMHHIYKKNIFLFLIMHPNFYFALFLAVITNASVASLGYVFIKTVDVGLKFVMMDMIFIKKEISHEMTLLLSTPISPALLYLSVAIYPPFVYFALQIQF